MKKVKIVEVGPRDGLQIEKHIVETADKVRFIDLLIDSGIKSLEVTSFVGQKAVPQLSDAASLFQLVKHHQENGVELISLVANLDHFEIASNVGVKNVALFTSTSDSFSKKNINCTVSESFVRLAKVAAIANKRSVKIRGMISTVFGCPYEGKTSISRLKQVIEKLQSFGANEIALCDTTGIATPPQVNEILDNLKGDFDIGQFALHFHSSSSLAEANILAAYHAGITIFDSSAGGLGGCPYAVGACGNISTERLLNLFDSLGVETGINPEKLANASSFISAKLKK